MEIFIISFTAFITAILTFFSGFGLGTILAPVLMIFFPVELAIALTGVVHFFNNIFKLFLVGKYANKNVLLSFGIPAVLAAIPGAWLLLQLSDLQAFYTYEMFGKTFEVSPIKLVIAILLIIFALMDLLPRFKNMQFDRNKLLLGGLLSGFFGGLSGNQGALRSAFLIKAGLSKEAFVGTAVVVSTFVDFTRLSVYATRLLHVGLYDNLNIILFATLSAVAGAYLGNQLLKKVTLQFVQITVAIMLLFLAIAIGSGLL
ncbi:MAG TPA: sulfite exporter TauE/SafE family protein [Saprospiraceae bacterium]|nr:sulfite exporter TauE/SafE family protein [Saprospiraceae bacterium]HMP12393.1 sulfite exporter TauE/SafE family protein [Saprospiraceae bacterium]